MSQDKESQEASLAKVWEPFLQTNLKALKASADSLSAAQNYWMALYKYQHDFFRPLFKAMAFFSNVESQRALIKDPVHTWEQYNKLLEYNWQIFLRSRISSLETMLDYHIPDLNKTLASWLNTWQGTDEGEDIFGFISRKARTAQALAQDYPRQIQEAADEFGFHFERGGYELIQETDRFYLYQVLPLESDVQIISDAKPILIVHPYVLGADILAFLPSEHKSYVHSFANQGIPTYVRILKDIDHPAVQKITLEDDIRDTQSFCSKIKERHGRALTLNGYCQGGLITLANLLSGELDGLVDTHITCVAPIDGTRSKGFTGFLGTLPSRFNDLAYGTKRLDNGNVVADGDLMAWVYKIKSIEDEAPTVAFYRDLAMMGKLTQKGLKISKTAAALNYWLTYQRHDLPLEITKLSFASYNTPISKDGTLPFTAFGRKLNMKRIQEKGIKWLICYGESDTLVEKDSALAPVDYVDAEVSPFPKGHVAIATSWSLPTSECALHTRFGANQVRGPVRFHLDLEAEEDQQPSREKASTASKGAKKQSSKKQKE
ncbi:MAG: metal transporter [Thermodesulfobacteriota bacterium]